MTLTPGQVLYRIPRVKSKRQTEEIQGQFVNLHVFPRLMIMQIRPCFLLIRSAVSQDLFKGADVHIQTCVPLVEDFCVFHFCFLTTADRHTRLRFNFMYPKTVLYPRESLSVVVVPLSADCSEEKRGHLSA